MEQIVEENTYYCKNCNYRTKRLYDFNRHISSPKHLGKQDIKHTCNCGKEYKHKTSLLRHQNNCYIFLNEKKCENEAITDLFKQYIEAQMIQTQSLINRIERQDTIIERSLTERQVTIQNNQSIQNNNFCLNIFLNETCQNALDLDDFVDSIEINLEDVEEMAQLDYATGISRLIVDRLQKATIFGRPLHCTDSKREVLYIKIKANWQKADDTLKNRFIQAIKQIAHKNMIAINLWTRQNPEWNDPSSKANDKYLRIVSNSMAGVTEEEQKHNMDKIVKNIMREVTIDKTIKY
jgi:hypothetical protein